MTARGVGSDTPFRSPFVDTYFRVPWRRLPALVHVLEAQLASGDGVGVVLAQRHPLLLRLPPRQTPLLPSAGVAQHGRRAGALRETRLAVRHRVHQRRDEVRRTTRGGRQRRGGARRVGHVARSVSVAGEVGNIGRVGWDNGAELIRIGMVETTNHAASTDGSVAHWNLFLGEKKGRRWKGRGINTTGLTKTLTIVFSSIACYLRKIMASVYGRKQGIICSSTITTKTTLI